MLSDKIKVCCASLRIQKDFIIENMLVKECKELKHVVNALAGSGEENEDFYKEMILDINLIETTFNELWLSI